MLKKGLFLALMIPFMLAIIRAQTPTLRDVFNPPTCQRACWLGIEPGVTTQTEVQSSLSGLDIIYSITYDTLTGVETEGVYWWSPDDNMPFIDNPAGQKQTGVYFHQGIVQRLELPVNIPLQMVISEYGAPNWNISMDSDSYLVYQSWGMVFVIHNGDAKNITRLYLEDEAIIAGLYEAVPPYSSDLQDCSFFGSPCPIATATPIPTTANTPIVVARGQYGGYRGKPDSADR